MKGVKAFGIGLRMSGSGCSRVQVSVRRICGLGCGFEVWGLGFEVWGLGLERVPSADFVKLFDSPNPQSLNLKS